MKYVGWIAFFLVIIGLAVGGFILINNIESVPFKYKDVEEVSYQNVDITDFVESKIVCNAKGCKYRKKDLNYKISEITKLGKQEITLDIEFENEKYSKIFEVNVVDKTKPVITLSETFIMLKINDKLDPKKYIKEVTDNYDKLNIDDVKIENNVDNKKEGKYEIIYSISDSSNNVGTAKLVVNVNKTVTSSSSTSSSKVTVNDAKKSDTTTVKNDDIKKDVSLENDNNIAFKPASGPKKPTEDFSLTISSVGAYTMNNTLTDENKSHKSNGEITYSFNNSEIDFNCSFGLSGNYNIDIIVKDVDTGKTISSLSENINGYGGVFTFTYDLGNYEITFRVQDLKTKNVYEEVINLVVKEPKDLTAVYIVNEDKGSYELLDCLILGGTGDYKFEYGIVDSNDPRVLDENVDLDDILELTDEGFKLKYKKGYYYEFVITIINNGKEISASKKIQK